MEDRTGRGPDRLRIERVDRPGATDDPVGPRRVGAPDDGPGVPRITDLDADDHEGGPARSSSVACGVRTTARRDWGVTVSATFSTTPGAELEDPDALTPGPVDGVEHGRSRP
jgi:hypothetical protein